MKKILVLGGGTFSYVRNHLALGTPAFGETAENISEMLTNEIKKAGLEDEFKVETVLTKMADRTSKIVVNEDVEKWVDEVILDKNVKVVVFNVALTDFDGQIDNVPSGKHAKRLKTKEGGQSMNLTPTKKLIGKFRKERKDLFVVGFKTTTDASKKDQYKAGLELLKNNSLNLVLANDMVTRQNMIIAPEETIYSYTSDRTDVLSFLSKMVVSRMQNKFTRSTVVEGEAVSWNSQDVPESLRDVVNHCIEAGAYKPFLGKTAGHFATKLNQEEILTSIRKTNFNNLEKVGLVRVKSASPDEVIAYGNRPSVGGQSQRIIFKEHPDLDCIVHFHCPVKEDSKEIPVALQWPNECGSHECGKNTSRNLKKFDLGNGDALSVVYLDNHGPNIVFGKNTPASKVIHFIENNFDLKDKTGMIFE